MVEHISTEDEFQRQIAEMRVDSISNLRRGGIESETRSSIHFSKVDKLGKQLFLFDARFNVQHVSDNGNQWVSRSSSNPTASCPGGGGL